MVLRDRANTAFDTTAFPQFHRDQEGKGLLQFGRIRFDGSDLRYRLVAELDGPVRVAFLQATATNKVCELGDCSLTGARYVFEVMGLTQPDGVIGGSIWERYPDPRFVRTGLDMSTQSWWATPGWFVTVGVEVVAESWDGARRVSITDAPRPIRQVTGVGEELFLEYGHAGIVRWTSASGVTPFLPRPSDVSGRMNGNFATDGKDMVWLSAEPGVDRPGLGTMELWTAPYTLDRLELDRTARRVVAFPYGIGPFPLSVGCGYVAAINGGGLAGPNMVVVRLRDSAKFEVGTRTGWISQTLGIHCGADGSNPEVIVAADDKRITRLPIAPMEAAGRDGG